VVAVVILGLVVRAYGVVAADFPLNDGGLFYQMIVDLREHGPLLPATTTYNGLEIPFAYPPLGLYLGALLHDLFGGIDVLRWVPLVLTTLTVPAFLLLARSMLGGTVTPIAATVAFALMPRSFEWLVMGGGLTRSLGLLLAIVALWLTWRMLRLPTMVGALLAGGAGGLTVLAHPQATLFVAAAGTLMLLARVRSGGHARAAGLALLVAAVIVAPWAAAMVSEHGLGPLLSAGQTQPGPVIGVFKVIGLDFAGARVSQVVPALTFAGILLALTHGRWLLPAWFAVVLLLDSRGGATYVTVPAAMLAGQAFVALVAAPFWRDPPSARRPSQYVRHHPVSAVLSAIIVFVATLDGLGSQLAPDWPGASLSADQRQGMTRLAEEGPEDARYLVVSGRPWPIDATAEWFPVLAAARSVATVQGTEWLEAGTYDRAIEASDELRRCAHRPSDCLDVWGQDWGMVFTHVYIPKGSVSGPLGDADCCVALRASLRDDVRYRVIHDDVGATVFERTDG
jgi:hypothetical protein